MKKDQYKITLRKIQNCLEAAEEQQKTIDDIKVNIQALKAYIPQRLELLDKVIKSMSPDGEKVNNNTLSLLKQAPKDIIRSSNRALKNAKPITTPELQSLIKEFHSISKGFATDYIELLKRNGIK